MEYSKCPLGKRCIIKTDDNYVFRKFTLLCAISNFKCVGATLYKEGGMIFYIFFNKKKYKIWINKKSNIFYFIN